MSTLQINLFAPHPIVVLGTDEQRLGWSAWLGERLQQEYVIRVAPETARSNGN